MTCDTNRTHSMNEAIKTALVLVAITLAATLSHAADDKIRRAVEQGRVTGEFLNTLTYDDVPDDWRAQKISEPNEKYTKLVFFRGGVRRLELLWSHDWTGDKEKMFVATVYHGDKRLTKIARVGDSTAVFPTDVPKGYRVMTSIKDDGTVIVTVTNDDDTFLEGIVLRGRDTQLLDDLEYTKSVLAIEGIAKPILDVIQDAVDKKPKKKGNKTK